MTAHAKEYGLLKGLGLGFLKRVQRTVEWQMETDNIDKRVNEVEDNGMNTRELI